MSFKKNTSQFQNILKLVLGVAFGVVALAVAYGALKQNTEGRSKAAEAYKILKQWEFNSTTGEGWDAQPPSRIIVGKGYLTLLQGKPITAVGMSNQNVSTSLPKGLKSMTFSIAVGSPIQKPQCPLPPVCSGVVSIVGQDKSKLGCDLYVCRPFVKTGTVSPASKIINSLEARSVQTGVLCTDDVRACPDGSYVSRTGPNCSFANCVQPPPIGKLAVLGSRYSGLVYYKLSNKTVYEKPLAFSGIVDGSFKTITLNFPEIQGITIDQMKVVFSSGIRPSELVRFDWIRLVSSSVIIPTGTSRPTPSCYPRPYCASGATCKLMAPPEGSVYCPISPTPTSCGPVACRIPPTGCRYINPGPCSCGTLICEVTTGTPTGTPIPTPIVVSAFKNAAVFDGTTSYLKLLQSNNVQPKLGFTLEGWFKPKSIKSGGTFISKMNGSSNSIDIQIMNEIDPQDSSKVRFHYELGVAGGGSCLRYTITHDRLVSLNQAFDWQHVAGVIQNDGKLDLFVNGQRSTSSSGTIASVCNRDLPIIIGARELSLNSADSFLGGLIDEVRISNISRYPDNFYPVSVPFTSDTNTVALYHLDQFSDEVNGLVQDFSGNGYTGAQWGTLSFTSH